MQVGVKVGVAEKVEEAEEVAATAEGGAVVKVALG